MHQISHVLNVDLITLLNTENEEASCFISRKKWVDFVFQLKELGMEKDQIQQYKTLIEFIKWKNENSEFK